MVFSEKRTRECVLSCDLHATWQSNRALSPPPAKGASLRLRSRYKLLTFEHVFTDYRLAQERKEWRKDHPFVSFLLNSIWLRAAKPRPWAASYQPVGDTQR